jgi:formamidopyrimidine-DNA glycosylase
MAELPEIETLRHDLDREVAGKRIKSAELSGLKSFRHHANRKQAVSKLEGAKITGVQRRGTLLVFKLDNDELLVVDISGAGQLLKAATREPVAPHTQAVLTFTQGGQLRFIDPTDGGAQAAVVPAGELDAYAPSLAELGRDPVDEPMSWVVFGDMLRSRKQKLKPFLMDPTVLAGIGNVYSDEILYDAGLRGDRMSDALSAQEVRRLYRAVVETLHEGLKHRGYTDGEQGWTDLGGRPGGYNSLVSAYGREGEACRRCRSVIVKKKVANRVSYFCEQCQV